MSCDRRAAGDGAKKGTPLAGRQQCNLAPRPALARVRRRKVAPRVTRAADCLQFQQLILAAASSAYGGGGGSGESRRPDGQVPAARLPEGGGAPLATKRINQIGQLFRSSLSLSGRPLLRCFGSRLSGPPHLGLTCATGANLLGFCGQLSGARPPARCPRRDHRLDRF